MLGLEQRLHQYEPFFGGWYLRGEIGSGSYGRVYRVENRNLFGVTYTAALKAIEILPEDKNLLDQPEHLRKAAYEEAMSEVETLAQLRGLSNVVHMDDHAVFEIRENGKLIGYDLLIRMELLENVGRTLRYHGGTLSSMEEVQKLGRDLSRGLVCCHQKGILHRDINPNNILRNAFGDYKLGDFGIAKQLHGTMHAQTAIGTKRYVAPEVVHHGGQDAYDARVDIYCLGLVLYQLANNGYLPFFHADMPKEQWEDAITRRLSGRTLPPPAQADEAFSEVILKACAYRPEDRYASAQELYDALQRLAYPQEQPNMALVPESQTGLLHRIEQAVTATSELRSVAEILHLVPRQPIVQTDVLSARMAARLPVWRIRAPWFPFNKLLLREYVSVAERAFAGRKDLAVLKTGGRMQRIGAGAFAQCTSLNEVRCGSGLTEIEENAFSGCSKLVRCQLPDTVHTLGSSVFASCTSLVSLNLPDSLTELPEKLCINCQQLGQVVLPQHVRAIGERAFSSSGLEKIVMPDSCIRLGTGVFMHCKNLRFVQVSLRLAIIPEDCFAGCTGLKQFDLPFRLTEIRERAFYGCTGLEHLVIPEGTRRIGAQAFDRCEYLRTIRIPSSVREIGDRAFGEQPKKLFGNGKLTVIASPKSYAWQYCKQQGIHVKASESRKNPV